MKKILYLLLAVSLSAALVGCGSGDDGGGYVPVPAAPSTATFKVINTSSQSIYGFYITDSTSNYGPRQNSNYITPGSTFTLTQVGCGKTRYYKVTNSSGTTLASNSRYISCGSTYNWTLY